MTQAAQSAMLSEAYALAQNKWAGRSCVWFPPTKDERGRRPTRGFGPERRSQDDLRYLPGHRPLGLLGDDVSGTSGNDTLGDSRNGTIRTCRR